MRVIVAIFIALIISGCSQLEGLAITPEDNAFACVRGSTNAVGGIVGAELSGITGELPQDFDTTDWTPDQWIQLAEVCD